MFADLGAYAMDLINKLDFVVQRKKQRVLEMEIPSHVLNRSLGRASIFSSIDLFRTTSANGSEAGSCDHFDFKTVIPAESTHPYLRFGYQSSGLLPHDLDDFSLIF